MPGTARGTMRVGRTLAALAITLAASGAVTRAMAQQPELTARIWTDRSEDAILHRGERLRLYYRTAADAYVAIFQIDTNGTVRLVYPRSPEENHYVRGGRDYRLLFPSATWWYVQDDPGVGYFFVVASPEPFDFNDLRYSHYEGGWDLSTVGRNVYTDPYVAMDDYVATLVPDWEYVPYALDFLEYSVEDRYEYPRFLCYDCHTFRPYYTWNPYLYTCTSFRVVVYDNPYYYPSTRYRGDQVVYVRPPSPGQPRFTFKERGRGEAGTPLVVERPQVGRLPGVPGSAQPRRSTAGIGSGGEARGSVPTRNAPVPIRGLGDPRATPRSSTGRPSDALPGRGNPVGAPLPGTTQRSGGDPGTQRPPAGVDSRKRPILQRRPTGSGGSGGSTRPTQALPRTSGGGSALPTRPTVRPTTGGGGSSTGSPTRRPVVRKPTGGGSSSPPKPVVRKPPKTGGGGGSSPPARPVVRKPPRTGGGGGSSPPSRPVVRKPPRTGGGGGSASPPRRAGGGGGF